MSGNTLENWKGSKCDARQRRPNHWKAIMSLSGLPVRFWFSWPLALCEHLQRSPSRDSISSSVPHGCCAATCLGTFCVLGSSSFSHADKNRTAPVMSIYMAYIRLCKADQKGCHSRHAYSIRYIHACFTKHRQSHSYGPANMRRCTHMFYEVYTLAGLPTSMYIHTYIRTYIHTHIHTYTCTCICTCTYLSPYQSISIHTCIHTYTDRPS